MLGDEGLLLFLNVFDDQKVADATRLMEMIDGKKRATTQALNKPEKERQSQSLRINQPTTTNLDVNPRYENPKISFSKTLSSSSMHP